MKFQSADYKFNKCPQRQRSWVRVLGEKFMGTGFWSGMSKRVELEITDISKTKGLGVVSQRWHSEVLLWVTWKINSTWTECHKSGNAMSAEVQRTRSSLFSELKVSRQKTRKMKPKTVITDKWYITGIVIPKGNFRATGRPGTGHRELLWMIF